MLTKTLNKILTILKLKRNTYSEVDQLRYLSQSVLIEEAEAPYVVRSTLVLISFIIIILIFWSAFAEVEEIAIAEGETIPSKHIQLVQHLEGGIVSEIMVREGDLIQKGQPILIVDGISVKRDLSSLTARRVSLSYQALRLRAFINNTIPEFKILGIKNDQLIKEQMKNFESMVEARENQKLVVLEQIDQKQAVVDGLKEKEKILKDNLRLADEEKVVKQKLFNRGHISKLDFLSTQKDYNDIKSKLQETQSDIVEAENAIKEYDNRLKSLKSNFIDDAYQELNLVETDLEQVKEQIKKLKERVDRLEVKSPSYGYVKVLNVKTIGGVIESGKTIAEIVPLEGNLIVEIKIKPRDIGHITIGQDVNVKVSSYDFSRYGLVEGKLKYISATTFANDDGTRYYMGRVSLEKNYVGKDSSQNLIVPGMTVQADIVTGSKSILSYLLKPINNAISVAFSER